MRSLALLVLLVSHAVSAQTMRTAQIAMKCIAVSRLSMATETVIYRDCDDGKLYVSYNGGAFSELIGAGEGLGTLATQSGTFSGTSSGTNTGDQTITLTSDVTGSGAGSFAATIANDAVTYAKLQNVATNKLLGRATGGSGDVEEITLGTNLSYTGTTLNAAGGGGVSDGDKGDISVTGSGATWTIDPGAVTLAKQAGVATSTVFYRKTAGAGAPEVQTLATLKTDLGLTGTNSGDQASIVGISGTLSEFNTALSDANFASGGGTATGTNTGDQTTVSGNAGSATALQTPRDINGVSFDGSANITVTAAAGTLTGATLAAGVTASSLTSVATNAITNAMSAQMATKTYKGRTTAGTGNAEDVAVATLKTDLVLVKGDVGLGSVDNTTDAGKPVSTAQQTALDLKANLAGPTFTGTVTLPAGTVTLAMQANMATSSLVYRKAGGSGAPEVNTLATLKTDLALVKGDVGLGNVDNTTDAGKPISTATATAINAATSVYVPLLRTSASHTATRVAGTYALGDGAAAAVSGTGTLYPISTIYIAAADYPTVNGLAPKLRIRAQLYTNDVAPTGNYTFGLYPITRPGTSGGAAVAIYTLGTVVSGSNGATFTAPAADGLLTAVGVDFALPADGHYVIGVVTTATVATNAHVHMIAVLQRHNL